MTADRQTPTPEELDPGKHPDPEASLIREPVHAAAAPDFSSDGSVANVDPDQYTEIDESTLNRDGITTSG